MIEQEPTLIIAKHGRPPKIEPIEPPIAALPKRYKPDVTPTLEREPPRRILEAIETEQPIAEKPRRGRPPKIRPVEAPIAVLPGIFAQNTLETTHQAEPQAFIPEAVEATQPFVTRPRRGRPPKMRHAEAEQAAPIQNQEPVRLAAAANMPRTTRLAERASLPPGKRWRRHLHW